MAIRPEEGPLEERRAGAAGIALGEIVLRAALLVFLAVALTWPAWINGHPLVFPDSSAYLHHGWLAVENALASLFAAADGTAGETDVETETAATNFVRSLGYSGFTYLSTLTPLGTFGIVLSQSLIVVGVVALLAGREVIETGLAWVAAAAAVIALTPLPWFTSFLMPDIFAAVAILTGLIMVRGIQDMGWLGYLFLLGAATFAAMSHYGHMPLALATGAAAIVILAFQRRLTAGAFVLGLAPTLLAAAINAASAQVVFSEPSLAPKRMPLLLARSIADGPALWYLEETCPERPYAICEVFNDRIPENLGQLLWGDDGLIQRGTPEQHARIRDEEFEILVNAFIAYPVQQTWSLTQNAVLQLGMIGTDDFRWGRLVSDPEQDAAQPEARRVGLDAVATVHVTATLAALLLIGALAWRDGLTAGRREREILVVLAIGLAANAAIFGGLSAPVDRYQSRVIWILPVLAALFWLARRRARPS